MFPFGETLVLPASRANRYNTLHFALQSCAPKGYPLESLFAESSAKNSKKHFPKGETCFLLFCYGRYCIAHSKRSNLLQPYVQLILKHQTFLPPFARLRCFLQYNSLFLCTFVLLFHSPYRLQHTIKFIRLYVAVIKIITISYCLFIYTVKRQKQRSAV